MFVLVCYIGGHLNFDIHEAQSQHTAQQWGKMYPLIHRAMLNSKFEHYHSQSHSS